jgi:hypothetical protein
MRWILFEFISRGIDCGKYAVAPYPRVTVFSEPGRLFDQLLKSLHPLADDVITTGPKI